MNLGSVDTLLKNFITKRAIKLSDPLWPRSDVFAGGPWNILSPICVTPSLFFPLTDIEGEKINSLQINFSATINKTIRQPYPALSSQGCCSWIMNENTQGLTGWQMLLHIFEQGVKPIFAQAKFHQYCFSYKFSKFTKSDAKSCSSHWSVLVFEC